MKNVSKNKFLTCFRPVVDLDTMLDESEDVKITYPSTNHCKHETQNSTNSSMFFSRNGSKLIESRAVDHPPKQTLSKVIKAVLFQTILVSLLNQHCLKTMINYHINLSCILNIFLYFTEYKSSQEKAV